MADLARDAIQAHARFVGGTGGFDLGPQTDERGSRNPTDLDSLDILGGTVATREYEALRDYVASLDAEKRLELKAVMLIGRGDMAAAQWEEAILQAGQVPESGDVDYLCEKISLHDYLTKALFALKQV